MIDRAKQLVSNESTQFENVLQNLETSRQEFERQKEIADGLKAEAEREKAEAQKLKDGIEQLRQQELEKAQSQALKIVEQAKRSAMALTQELEELKKQSDKSADKAEMLRKAKQMMKKGFANFDDITNPVVAAVIEDENYTLPRELKIGDEVLVADMGKTATVTALNDRKGNVEVMAGIMKMRTPESNLRLIEKGKQPKNNQKPRNVPNRTERVFSPGSEAQTRCDLRGKNVEEGVMEVDRYIDQALRLGLGEITVIHGKGTGVLRKGIHEYLRKNRYVKSFRLGVYGEGETGVTIVTLK